MSLVRSRMSLFFNPLAQAAALSTALAVKTVRAGLSCFTTTNAYFDDSYGTPGTSNFSAYGPYSAPGITNFSAYDTNGTDPNYYGPSTINDSLYSLVCTIGDAAETIGTEIANRCAGTLLYYDSDTFSDNCLNRVFESFSNFTLHDTLTMTTRTTPHVTCTASRFANDPMNRTEFNPCVSYVMNDAMSTYQYPPGAPVPLDSWAIGVMAAAAIVGVLGLALTLFACSNRGRNLNHREENNEAAPLQQAPHPM